MDRRCAKRRGDHEREYLAARSSLVSIIIITTIREPPIVVIPDSLMIPRPGLIYPDETTHDVSTGNAKRISRNSDRAFRKLATSTRMSFAIGRRDKIAHLQHRADRASSVIA